MLSSKKYISSKKYMILRCFTALPHAEDSS